MTANQPQQDANDKASASGVHPGTSGSGKNTVSYEAKFLKKIFSKLNHQNNSQNQASNRSLPQSSAKQ